ncbi:hypothetical protein EST38_g5640 [Candolleomyces aberdarensis]|uniref:G protein-coupled receptor n=1 Tax=Candolleomyces aberdarensis TaxID=2316362 RepID=A0A4Q2DJZ3_9AGAR|nr:hypothetical protein EST38_g5640 [Candolleomyces aberdarensis]
MASKLDYDFIGRITARVTYVAFVMPLVSIDVYWIFDMLFHATSPINFLEIAGDHYRTWGRLVTIAVLTAVVSVGDLLLVYRCYIVWAHLRWVVIPPALTCLGALGMGIYILFVTTDGQRQEAAYEISRVFLTVATNLMVTVLIAFHLLRMRRSLSKLLPKQDHQLYTGPVAILIESALPLTVFGLAYAPFLVVPLPQSDGALAAFLVAYNTMNTLFYMFCALSPHMIIFRVTTGRSWLRLPLNTSSSEGSGVTNPIGFAHQYRTPEESLFQSSVMEKPGGVTQASV